MRYLEDLVEGSTFSHSTSYVVTEEEIMEVGRRWDPQVFHTDPVAAKDSFFGGLVASTVHLFAIFVALGTQTPDDEKIAAVSALGFEKLEMRAPTRPGDVITQQVEVVGVRPSKSRPELGILQARTDLRNQRSEIVFSIEAASLIQRRP